MFSMARTALIRLYYLRNVMEGSTKCLGGMALFVCCHGSLATVCGFESRLWWRLSGAAWPRRV
jgi:hypothetical protein